MQNICEYATSKQLLKSMLQCAIMRHRYIIISKETYSRQTGPNLHLEKKGLQCLNAFNWFSCCWLWCGSVDREETFAEFEKENVVDENYCTFNWYSFGMYTLQPSYKQTQDGSDWQSYLLYFNATVGGYCCSPRTAHPHIETTLLCITPATPPS